MRNHAFFDKLVTICGKERVLMDASALLAYESDGLSFHRHKPDCVVIPENSQELEKLMQLVKGEQIPYVIRGAGTGLSGACVAEQGGLMIHLSRMKNILEIRPEDLSCVVEPGVVLNS